MSIKEPIVYTNLLFFGNAIVYGLLGFPSLMILFFFTAFFSLQYHRFPNSFYWHSLDRVFATMSLFTVLAISWFELSFLNFGLLFLLAISTLLVKRYGDLQTNETYYRKCHTLWHYTVFFANFVSAVVLYKF